MDNEPHTIIVLNNATGRALETLIKRLSPLHYMIQRVSYSTKTVKDLRNLYSGINTPLYIRIRNHNENYISVPGLLLIDRNIDIQNFLKRISINEKYSNEQERIALFTFFDGLSIIASLVHDVLVNLRKIDTNKVENEYKIFSNLVNTLQNFGFHTNELEIYENSFLTGSLSTTEIRRIRYGLNNIMATVAGNQISNFNIPLYNDIPAPEGLRTILIADDHGALAEWISCLTEFGYVINVITDKDKIFDQLIMNPPDVFICDLQWAGDSFEGRRIIAKMRDLNLKDGKCKVIVALSSRPNLRPEDVPEAHIVYGGIDANYPEGANKLHSMIIEFSKKVIL